MAKQKTQHVDDPVAVGTRIRNARERAGLSQRELAGDDCTAAYVSRLELGQRVPSIQLLRQLGKRLGIDADFLATGLASDGVDRALLVDAEVALRLDDPVSARQHYERALEELPQSDPGRGEAMAGLGRVALREGAFEEAIELLTRSI